MQKYAVLTKICDFMRKIKNMRFNAENRKICGIAYTAFKSWIINNYVINYNYEVRF